MKLNFFKFILLFSTIAYLSSCLSTTDTTVTSTNASFVSLKFGTNDSIPNLSSAVFTLEPIAGSKDSVIVNLDSLPYKTRIDSVYPTFAFKTSAGSFLHITTDQGYKFTKGRKDSVLITGKDTVDFRQPLLRVSNFATDGKSYKSYSIKVNVHKVQPELYVWNKTSDDIDINNATSQKAIIFNDTIFYYLNNGTSAFLYKSTDGKSWASLPVSGLPAGKSLNDMQLFNGKLYLTSKDEDKIYSTTDRRNWTVKANPDYNYKSLLFIFQDRLWAIVKSKSTSDANNRFATSVDGNVWIITSIIPDKFPVSDFASIAFSGRTGKPKALVLGGLLDNGDLSNHTWSTEGEVVNGDYYWVDFNFDNNNHSLDTLAVGASVISYDKKLLLFGLRKDKSLPHFKQSVDEGLSWQAPDTLYNRLPKSFISRNYQSVVVYKPSTYNKLDTWAQDLESNRIFIIGGKANATALSDVWTGKLNRKNFLLQ